MYVVTSSRIGASYEIFYRFSKQYTSVGSNFWGG